jgi:hypothetical protein
MKTKADIILTKIAPALNSIEKVAISFETLLSAGFKTKGTPRAHRFVEHAIQRGDKSFKGTLNAADKTRAEAANLATVAGENANTLGKSLENRVAQTNKSYKGFQNADTPDLQSAYKNE